VVVNIEQRRATIGHWSGGRPGKYVKLQKCIAQTSNHIGYRQSRFLLLVSLLVISCLELNPGPDNLMWVHTSTVNAYRNAVTLQVAHTIRSYDLKFHCVPHGVTVFCELYTRRFPVYYGTPSDVIATSSGFVNLYGRGDKTTVHNNGSVQRSMIVGRLEFSVDERVI
jgi:hypothetical protein